MARGVALVAGALTVALGADGWIAVAALAVVGGWLPGAAGALALAASQLRWGTADLGAIAGDQDVLGAAIVVGPAAGWASAALGAASLLAASQPGPPGTWSFPMPPVLVGVLSGALFLGPRPVVAYLAVAVVGWAAWRWGWPRQAAVVALVTGTLGVGLASLV
jgi:hypothetical protein